jgi:hypothetical protein
LGPVNPLQVLHPVVSFTALFLQKGRERKSLAGKWRVRETYEGIFEEKGGGGREREKEREKEK